MNKAKLIKSKYILTMNDSLDVIEDAGVYIEKNSIIGLGKFNILNTQYPDAEVIDLKHHILLPGFINTHTHAAMCYFRGLADDLPLSEWLHDYIWPAESKYINAEFVRQAAALACLEMIKSGITCFSDMYFFENEVAETAKKFGMRAVIGEGILDLPTPSAENTNSSLAMTQELINRYKTDDLIAVSVAPHSIYAASASILEKCAQMARDNQTILHIHVSETREEVENSLRDNKLTPVQYLDKIGFLGENVLSAHSVWLDRSEIETYAAKNVKVSHNPSSNLKLASGVAPVKDMMAKKIIVGLGTDGAASNNSLNMFSEMKLTALLHKGINLDPVCVPAVHVLKMATIDAAKCLGLDKIIGSIEIGKRADIIAVDFEQVNTLPIHNIYSNLVYSGCASSISDVIINGEIIMRNSKINVDEEKIINDAKKFLIK